ncbi:hypothetical protein JVT61DRAFT_7138 [Boletus reticuloceps]|uniref:Uncharacterized protein n=1 Tax=Boletus reticuloceps TaxID=495285 RepID=A0A8I2YI36_9AGAM|nr:hypothetical protein JVT61DRAFT_7138 [Boletus reticuloceps]
MFDIGQDTDFLAHEPAPAQEVYSFEHEDGPGPSREFLAFDLSRSATSPWNSTILEILLREFQKTCTDEKWAIKRSDNYVRELLKNRYKKLHTVWLKGQPKLLRDGRLETEEEVEARLLAEMDRQAKASRQATRRRNKYTRRVTTLNHVVALKIEEGDSDVAVWEWLSCLIKTLGEDGMSSEESAVENQIEHVLRVKQMEWRRCINHELDIIDTQRLLDDDIFARQGAKPVKRIRAHDNPESSRDALFGLPMAFYDGAWVAGLSQRQLDALNVSWDTFEWMKVATT